MRIGLIGWYGHDNAGDDRILLCLRRFFEGHELIATSGLDDALARIAELNCCDYVLLGGGGLILRGTGWFAEVIERLTPRFGCVGISVEARHADNFRTLEALKERAEFILVRDQKSRQLLDCHFKTIVGPDLTFLYPYLVASTVVTGVCGVNLRPWRFWPGEHNGKFDLLMQRLHHRVPGLERAFPFAKWDAAKLVGTLKSKFHAVTPIPLYLEKGASNDRDVLSQYLPEVPLEFEIEQFSRCRYLVAMRLHALIFACQMGLPFLSLSYEPKNREFCNSLGMPELSLDIFRPDSFGPAMDWLKSEYPSLRSKLLAVREKNHVEITVIMTAIRRLVTDTVEPGRA